MENCIVQGDEAQMSKTKARIEFKIRIRGQTFANVQIKYVIFNLINFATNSCYSYWKLNSENAHNVIMELKCYHRMSHEWTWFPFVAPKKRGFHQFWSFFFYYSDNSANPAKLGQTKRIWTYFWKMSASDATNRTSGGAIANFGDSLMFPNRQKKLMFPFIRYLKFIALSKILP